MNLERPEKPTFYFIGVTTSQSSIMKLFPLWAKALQLNADIKGIDIDLHAEPSVYREAVEFIKKNDNALGALVTTHKIDIYHSAKDLFDKLDPSAELFGELSCISKRNGKLLGHAKDHISSNLAMNAFLPPDYWKTYQGEAFIMGAGGSAIAIASNLISREKGTNRPGKIYVSDLKKERLDSMKSIMEKIDKDIPFEFWVTNSTKENDHVLADLKAHSLIVNATGLGKDRVGSPLTDQGIFPMDGIVWELNYRGNLIFVNQAKHQTAERNLKVVDGWIYFIHGWTQVISEVFHIEISPEQFNLLEKIASDLNNQRIKA